MTSPVCNHCGAVLNCDNWYPSFEKRLVYKCKTCHSICVTKWQKNNKSSLRDNVERYRRKNGAMSMTKNKECSLFLGVYVAETVLSNVFKDVEQMPHGNIGFDFICNHQKRIDVKSSCRSKRVVVSPQWGFTIRKNKIADYFLCIAFDNRTSLNPLYVWMIPGHILNTRETATISESTISKWSDYALPIDKVVSCCNTMRGTTK